MFQTPCWHGNSSFSSTSKHSSEVITLLIDVTSLFFPSVSIKPDGRTECFPGVPPICNSLFSAFFPTDLSSEGVWLITCVLCHIPEEKASNPAFAFLQTSAALPSRIITGNSPAFHSNSICSTALSRAASAWRKMGKILNLSHKKKMDKSVKIVIYSQYLWNIKVHDVSSMCSTSRMQSTPTENTALGGFPRERA